MIKLLVIEDNRAMRLMLNSILTEKGYQVDCVKDCSSAHLLLKKEIYHIIISDYQLPDMDGVSFFKKIKKLHIPFILITAYGSIELAVKAMKEGVFDFLPKPVDPDYLFLLIEKALETTRIERENIIFKEIYGQKDQPTIIGESQAIRQIADKVKKVSKTDTPVLLLGESGTGKELFARTIHNLSDRSQNPFIPINSASIPENLLENELFGHERGSFTDATTRQMGKLELAQTGSFFMDEIGDFPLQLQGKILRVLEEKKFTRLGGSHIIDLNLRFIFATNKNLEKEVFKSNFRQDLFYRINIFPITIPPLRERKEDILLLTNYFVKKFSTEIKKGKCSLDKKALQKLINYDWPGNIRELMNTIERAIIISNGPTISPGDIILSTPRFMDQEELDLNGTLKEIKERAIRKIEKTKISSVLAQTENNKKEAAVILGISYKSLFKKLKDYNIK